MGRLLAKGCLNNMSLILMKLFTGCEDGNNKNYANYCYSIEVTSIQLDVELAFLNGEL